MLTLQLSSDNTAAAELRVMTCALRALGVLNSVGGWNRRRRGRPRPAESAAMMAWSRGVVVAGGAAAHRVVAGQIGIVVGWLLLYLRIPSVDRLLLHRQRPSLTKAQHCPCPNPPSSRTVTAVGTSSVHVRPGEQALR